MLEFLVFVLFLIALFTIVRTQILRRRLDVLAAQNRHLDSLTARIWALEQALAKLTPPLPGPAPEPPSPSVVETAPETIEPPVVPVPAAEEIPVTPPSPAPEPEPLPAAAAIPPILPPAIPGPTWRDRLASQEWEAVVGGNWLNKLGVLVLIIGIALLLGYSFTRVGPAGRVAIALAVSGGMLAGGAILERRSVYRIFARGLIGGGWAGIYFTAYAMYAVDAAKVIDSPWLASILLAAVAACMIGHSLKYRSQTVTGLAYFIAFATLVLTPVNSFAFVAIIPLTASLIYLAHRFEWFEMALFGVLATYGTCIARGDSGASIASSQAILGFYWLLFEVFTILRAARPGPFTIPQQWIFPLNTLGIIALSLPKWHSVRPHHVWVFAAACGALHLAGAAVRYRVRPPDPGTPLMRRMSSAGYEGPATIAAALVAASIWLKLTGVWINFGLLVEAELFFLAGLSLRQAYLQRLGAAVFGVATLKLAALDVPSGSRDWWPAALLSSALMYLDRYLRRTAQYFSWGAVVPLLLVAGFETPQPWVAVSWFVLAAVLFEFGLRQRLIEFRLQSYVFAASAMVAMLLNHRWQPVGICVLVAYWLAVRATRLTGQEGRYASLALAWSATLAGAVFAAVAAPPRFIGAAWIGLAAVMVELGLRELPRSFRWQSYPVAVLGWVQVVVMLVEPADRNVPLESRLALGAAALLSYAIAARVFSIDRFYRIAGSSAGSLFTATLMWIVLPDPVVAPGWALLSLVLLQFDARVLRTQADLIAAATFGRLFLANFVNLGSTFGISHRLLTVAPVIAGEYHAWFRRRGTRIGRIYLWAAPILAVFLMRFELGRVLTVIGWSALVLLLFWIGLRRKDLDFRLQSYLLALVCFWRSWTTNFYVPDSFAGVSGRIATGAFVVATFYVAQFLAPRESTGKLWLDRHARSLFSVLATALVSLMLYYEVGGAVLTVAWGVQATALMTAGFWGRDRVLRLCALLLFLNCILKLFFYDLRYLDTISRIFSFIVLGGVMVAVSWVYTRFRSQIQRYL